LGAYLTYILEFRSAIDGYCARTLAANPRREVLDALDAELARQRDLLKAANWNAWPDVNIEFHCILARSVRNPVIESAVVELGSHTVRLGFFMREEPGWVRNNVAAHTAIVEAVRRGDPDAAQRLACEHLRVTGELIHGKFAGPPTEPLERPHVA
jgi:DNA-binding GntR family transcriptional regulator